jgi:hypothetical protein
LPDPILETLARDQKRWSLTAGRLKKSIGRSRIAVMMLAVVGAVLETLGAETHGSHPDNVVVIGYLGAAALALLGVIRQLRLGRERVQAWILARAASESFKKEMYLYRTSTAPYSDQQKNTSLINRRDEILRKIQTIQLYVVEPKDSQFKKLELLNIEGYREERLKGQIKYFRYHAKTYSELQDRFGVAEFILAIGAALLGAALTMTGKQPYGAWVSNLIDIGSRRFAPSLSPGRGGRVVTDIFICGPQGNKISIDAVPLLPSVATLVIESRN